MLYGHAFFPQMEKFKETFRFLLWKESEIFPSFYIPLQNLPDFTAFYDTFVNDNLDCFILACIISIPGFKIDCFTEASIVHPSYYVAHLRSKLNKYFPNIHYKYNAESLFIVYGGMVTFYPAEYLSISTKYKVFSQQTTIQLPRKPNQFVIFQAIYSNQFVNHEFFENLSKVHPCLIRSHTSFHERTSFNIIKVNSKQRLCPPLIIVLFRIFQKHKCDHGILRELYTMI